MPCIIFSNMFSRLSIGQSKIVLAFSIFWMRKRWQSLSKWTLFQWNKILQKLQKKMANQRHAVRCPKMIPNLHTGSISKTPSQDITRYPLCKHDYREDDRVLPSNRNRKNYIKRIKKMLNNKRG